MDRDRFYRLMATAYPEVRLKDYRIKWTALTPHGSYSWSRMLGWHARVSVSGTPGLYRIISGGDWSRNFETLEQAQEFAESEAYQALWELLCDVLSPSQAHISRKCVEAVS